MYANAKHLSRFGSTLHNVKKSKYQMKLINLNYVCTISYSFLHFRFCQCEMKKISE